MNFSCKTKYLKSRAKKTQTKLPKLPPICWWQANTAEAFHRHRSNSLPRSNQPLLRHQTCVLLLIIPSGFLVGEGVQHQQKKIPTKSVLFFALAAQQISLWFSSPPLPPPPTAPTNGRHEPILYFFTPRNRPRPERPLDGYAVV